MIDRYLPGVWPTLLLLVGMLSPLPLIAQETDPDSTEDPNPAGLILQRDHAAEFVGGEELIVQVAIAAADDQPLFALGLYETIPTGWTFEGLYVDAGPAPDILPPQGATGVLEFGWVSPAVPVQLRYALRIPPRDEGARFITGQVEYRLESDPRRNSAPLLTQLEGVANEIPVVTLVGPALLPWSRNEAFVDPGARAQDGEDGDLSNEIQVVGQVDVTTPGEYTLTYGVTDSAGNRADPVTRSVRVQEADTPDGTDAPAGDGGGDSDTMAPPPQGNPTAAPIPRSSSAQPGLNITVPPISLGTNRPQHHIPPGEDGDDTGADPDASPPGETRRFRDSSTPAPSAIAPPASRALSETDGISGAPSSEDPDPGTPPSRITFGALSLLVLAVGLIVVQTWRHGPGASTRRRRR